MIWQQIFNNTPIWAAAFAWIIAQGAKILIILLEKKTFDFSRLYGMGGMPSSHSALVMALSMSIGKNYGFDTPAFSVSIVTALVVMYDAAGVRRAAGKHAAAINILFSQNGMKLEEHLKELLGHTPFQVLVGAILGSTVGFLF